MSFPRYEEPDNPFHHNRVRQAVRLTLHRQYLPDTETQGLALPTGDFIVSGKGDYLERSVREYDLEKAKQLMAEAGFGDGLEAACTPSPLLFSLAERLKNSLGEVGIESELNVTQRPVGVPEHVKGEPGGLSRCPNCLLHLSRTSHTIPLVNFVPSRHVN